MSRGLRITPDAHEEVDTVKLQSSALAVKPAKVVSMTSLLGVSVNRGP